MYKLLIADDERMIREGMAKYIPWHKIGFHVEDICEDGKQVLEVLKEKDIDVVLTDIKMPFYDGLDIINITKEQKIDTYFAIISAHSDFEYAQKAMENGVKHFITKPVKMDKISEVFKKIKLELDERSSESEKLRHMEDMIDYTLADARKWVINSLLEGQTIKKWQIKEYGFDFSREYFQIGVIKINDYKEDSSIIKSIIEDKLSEKNNCTFYTVENNLCGFVILFNYDSCKIDESIKSLENYLQTFISGIVKTIISSKYKDIYQTHDKFIEVIKRLKSYQHPKKIDISTNRTVEYPNVTENKIFYNIDIGDEDKLLENYNSFIDHIKNENMYIKKEYLLQFAIRLKIYLKNKNCNINDIIGEGNSITSMIMKDDNFYQIKELIENILIKTHKYISSDMSCSDNLAMKMKEYIYNNCSKDISLEVMAEHFHMNPIYLSSFFKKHNNMNYVNYLIDCRMKLAKQLLETSEINVNEISSKVGYTNSKHFSIVFRKNTGLTPSQYRKLNYKDKG